MSFCRVAIVVAAIGGVTAAASSARLGPERTLAGITVGSKGIVVLHHYGNPTNVTPGLGQAGPATPAGSLGPGTNPYAQGPGGLPPGVPPGYSPGVPPQLRRPGVPPGVPPGYGPMGPGGPSSLPPAGADASASGGETTDNTGLTTWTYRKRSGTSSIDFRLNEDGTVVEIVATGINRAPQIHTARGVTLGDPYGKVMRLYGFPEVTDQQGNVMTVRYQKSAHIAFQFYKLKVVRIDVALPKKNGPEAA